MSQNCPECGAPRVAGAPFCLQCGAELVPPVQVVETAPLTSPAEPGPSPALRARAPTLVPTPTAVPSPAPLPRPKAVPQTRVLASEARRPLVGWLYSFDFDPSGQSWVLRQGRSGIGRDPAENLVLLERDPSISRRHAAIICRDSGVYVRDGDSQYGTRVNGEDIGMDARPLADGDQIQICGYTLTLRLL